MDVHPLLKSIQSIMRWRLCLDLVPEEMEKCVGGKGKDEGLGEGEGGEEEDREGVQEGTNK